MFEAIGFISVITATLFLITSLNQTVSGLEKCQDEVLKKHGYLF